MDAATKASHYLALLAQHRIGPATVRALTAVAGDIETLVSGDWHARSALLRSPEDDDQPSTPELLKRLGSLPRLMARSLPTAVKSVAAAKSAGLSVLNIEDPDYPAALLHGLSDPPPVLFVAGDLPAALGNHYELLPACAVVGTRRASRFSLTFARDLGREMAEIGFVVVSGLALGIDAAAHAGALEGRGAAQADEISTGPRGTTVAVLGGGHGRFHPKANRALATAIVGAAGAVISEWPPDTDPAPHQFLQRNRIISGLSRAVVIVEAGARSGALNTAAHAIRQGRDLLVVPGRPGPTMAGNLSLLREGAVGLFIGLSDLYTAFHNVEPVGRVLGRLLDQELGGASGNESARPTTVAPLSTGAAPLAELVVELLNRLGEATADQLLEHLNSRQATTFNAHDETSNDDTRPIGIAALGAALLELELRGDVITTGNGRFHSRALLAGARSRVYGSA